MWWAPLAAPAPRPPGHSSSPGALWEDDLSGPWESQSGQPPWPSRRRDTSGTCRTGSGSSSACPRGSSCPPDRRTWRSSEQFSWRSPCSPRRSSRRSAGTRRCPRTRRTAARVSASDDDAEIIDYSSSKPKQIYLKNWSKFRCNTDHSLTLWYIVIRTELLSFTILLLFMAQSLCVCLLLNPQGDVFLFSNRLYFNVLRNLLKFKFKWKWRIEI